MALLLLIAGLHLRGWIAAAVLLGVAVVFYAMQAPWVATLTELFKGKRNAMAIAAVNMMGIVGGFVGPYWTGWMREVTGGFAVGVGSLCVPWLIFAASIAWVTRGRAEAKTEAAVELIGATEKSL